MSLDYFGLLDWLQAPTEREKALVWLRVNPMPVCRFQMPFDKYKPQIIFYFLEAFLWTAIARQRVAWQQTKYAVDPAIHNFWFSPLGEIYKIWFGFYYFVWTFDQRINFVIWKYSFFRRRFLKEYFAARR